MKLHLTIIPYKFLTFIILKITRCYITKENCLVIIILNYIDIPILGQKLRPIAFEENLNVDYQRDKIAIMVNHTISLFELRPTT